MAVNELGGGGGGERGEGKIAVHELGGAEGRNPYPCLVGYVFRVRIAMKTTVSHLYHIIQETKTTEFAGFRCQERGMRGGNRGHISRGSLCSIYHPCCTLPVAHCCSNILNHLSDFTALNAGSGFRSCRRRVGIEALLQIFRASYDHHQANTVDSET